VVGRKKDQRLKIRVNQLHERSSGTATNPAAAEAMAVKATISIVVCSPSRARPTLVQPENGNDWRVLVGVIAARLARGEPPPDHVFAEPFHGLCEDAPLRFITVFVKFVH
jgi:hypothetical protein